MPVKYSEILSLHEAGDSYRQGINQRGRYIRTTRYLAEGLIHGDSLNEEGLYVDAYDQRAQYIDIISGRKEVVCRIISADDRGILSLPTAEHFQLDSGLVKQVAGVNRLSELKPKDVVEVSALAGNPESVDESHQYDGLEASNMLYATALRRSLDAGHKLWLMNVDEEFRDGLNFMLGDHNITQLGDPQQYMGGPSVPICLSPSHVVEYILQDDSRVGQRNKRYLKNTLQGVSEKHLSKNMLKLLELNDISTSPASPLETAAKHRWAILYTGMIGYSALRFIPLTFVPEYDGGILQYGLIDVGTAASQVMGMELYFKGDTRLKRAVGAAAAVGSFMAPYGFVATFNKNGSPLDYPAAVYAVASGFAAISVGLEALSATKDASIKRGLEAEAADRHN